MTPFAFILSCAFWFSLGSIATIIGLALLGYGTDEGCDCDDDRYDD